MLIFGCECTPKINAEEIQTNEIFEKYCKNNTGMLYS